MKKETKRCTTNSPLLDEYKKIQKADAKLSFWVCITLLIITALIVSYTIHILTQGVIGGE
jgi:hypothetical protein